MGMIYKQCGWGEFETPYICDPCAEGELGRVRSLALVKKGTVISLPLDAFEWELQVGIGNIILLPNVRGSFDGGTPRMVTGYGSNTELKVGDDYVLTASDPRYVDNAEFWEEAERQIWNLCYISEKTLNYVSADVQLMAKAAIDEDLNSVVDWDIELRWFSKLKPIVTPVLPVAYLFSCEDNAEFEVITGLTIASGSVTPQVVNLKVDSDKDCKVILPDGSILTSTNGLINTTWTGAAGAVTLMVQKSSSYISMETSDFIGELVVINATDIDASYCTSLTSISAPNATYINADNCTSLTSLFAPNATYVNTSGCTSLTSLSAPNATTIYASGCALTAIAIAALFAELVATGNIDGTMDISGGTSATYGSLSAQAQDDIDTLSSRNWSLTYNV